MKRQFITEVVVIGVVLVVFALVPLAVGGQNTLSGIERPVMEALETPSFGTERPVMEALETPSEDLAKWADAWEYFSSVEIGSLPEPASEELSEDDLGIPEERRLEDTYFDD